MNISNWKVRTRLSTGLDPIRTHTGQGCDSTQGYGARH